MDTDNSLTFQFPFEMRFINFSRQLFPIMCVVRLALLVIKENKCFFTLSSHILFKRTYLVKYPVRISAHPKPFFNKRPQGCLNGHLR